MTSSTRSLIIGGSGQVGAQLAGLLPSNTIITSREQSSAGRVHLDLLQIAGNLRAAAELIQRNNIGVVYCVGAMTYVDGCEAAESDAMRINCEGPSTLAAAATRFGAKFVYFSTDYVFDGTSGPYSEGEAGSPINAYGRSKWLGEAAVQEAAPDALIIRTTGVYGPDKNAKNFLYTLRRELQSGNRSFRVPNDQFANPTYNIDLAEATLALVQEKASGIVNVAGPDFVSRLEFAQRSAAAMGLDPSAIQGVPTLELKQVAPRPLRAGLMIDKLNRLLPSIRMRGIEEAVKTWAAEAQP